MNKLIATCFGIGYIQKGAGTIAALFCCLTWYLLKIDQANLFVQLFYLLILFFAGVFTASKVENDWGHDSKRVVIDEWMGMGVALFMVPFSLTYFSIAFLLFRLFDIAKPFFIRRAETAPGGWGVMLDDLLAGIYSAVILQLLIKSHLF
ncbi:MAG: phosphatidylglycerophosphatase A [Chitinophagaceae bacterium]|nr:MAG: phosphatidylglycerophosphatase A [Chitinophagaceae bacterium]